MAGEPEWLSTVTIIGTSIGAAVTAIIVGIRSGKKSEPEGDAKLVMGALISPQAVSDLSNSIRNVDGSIRELVELMKAERHDRELADAVRAELDKRSKSP